MAITEEARHQLYKAMEDLIGVHNASTLMEHLPGVGWADVTTKRDLEQLEERVELRFQNMDLKFQANLHRELRHQMNVLLPSIVVSNVALAGSIIAALKLF